MISIKYRINDKKVFEFAINVHIYPDQNPVLSYSQQLVFKDEIINLLSKSAAKGRIITIGGKKGTGKNYLLKDIFYHFRQTRQTAFFEFYPQDDFRNKMILCRLISFINFGEIIRIFNMENTDMTIDYCRSVLESFDPVVGDLNLILEAFEGCYDEIIASKLISVLCKDDTKFNRIITPKTTPVSHLAIIDKIENLNIDESTLIHKIINYSMTCNSICFLLVPNINNNSTDYYL